MAYDKAIWSRGEICEGMRRTIQWDGDVGVVERRQVKVVCGIRQGCPLLPLLFNIYLVGMAGDLQRAQLGVKLDGCWCGALLYANDFILVVDTGA